MVLLGIAFFLSGAAALVYQVVWQRILTLHTGIGVVSVALIVAAFMAGLGLGSHLGGVLSARVSPRRALRLFALLELGVGLFASISCRLYYDGFGSFAAGLYATTAGAAVAHLIAFLLPTTLMGMSLPFLVRATVRETASASAGHRCPLRRERAGRFGRRPSRAVGAHPLPRTPGRGAHRRRRQPRGRGRGARRGPPGRRRGRGGGDRASPAGRGARRGAPSRVVPALDAALRPLRVPRPLARDRLVPADGCRGEEHGLHVRDRPLPLPARPGRRQPRRRKARTAPRASPRGVPGLPAPVDRLRGRGRRPPRGVAAGDACLRVALRLLAARAVLSPRCGLERGRPGAALRPAASRALRGAHRPDGALVRRAAARGAGRPGHEWPQGRDPPGRQHRRLHRREPRHGPRPSRADRHRRDGPPSRRRLRHRLPPGAGPDRGPHPRLARPGGRPRPRPGRAALERQPLETASRGDRGRAPVLHRRGRERRERHLPG